MENFTQNKKELRRISENKVNRYPIVSALLSIIHPGFGQFYLYNTIHGLVHLLIQDILIVLWIFVFKYEYTLVFLGFIIMNILSSSVLAFIETYYLTYSEKKIREKIIKSKENLKKSKLIEETKISVKKKEDKVVLSLKTKLFGLIIFLLLTLILTVYFLTTFETEAALISEMRKKGEVMAKQIARSASAVFVDKAFEFAEEETMLPEENIGNENTEPDKKEKSDEVKIPDLSVPQLQQIWTELSVEMANFQDVIYGEIINKDALTVIYKDANEGIQNLQQKKENKPFNPPAGIYTYNELFYIKTALSNVLIDEYKTRVKYEKNKGKIEREILTIEYLDNNILTKVSNYLDENKKAYKKESLNLNIIKAFDIIKNNLNDYDKFRINFQRELNELLYEYDTRFINVNYKILSDGIYKSPKEYIQKEFEKIGIEKLLWHEKIEKFTEFIDKYIEDYTKKIKELKKESKLNNSKGLEKEFYNFKLELNLLSKELEKTMSPKHAIVQIFYIGDGDNKEKFLDVSYPIVKEVTKNDLLGYQGEVHIGLSLRNINYTINNTQRTIQLIAIFDMILGVILTFLLATFMVRPIRRIVRAMRRIGDGDLSTKVTVGSNDEIGLLAKNFNEMVSGLREKERIRNVMDKAVSKEIAEYMLKGEVKLGGEERNITIFFSDIRGFTSISESMTPEELILMLNEYMTEMNNIIDKYKGVVDKFIGDAIMAIFGAPVPILSSTGEKMDAEYACMACVDMLRALDKWNEQRRKSGKLTLRVGMGLNTGDIVAGNMGSDKRLNYTVLGDNVNLASRLEGATKMYKVAIAISQSTFDQIVHKDKFIYRELDKIRVVGKKEAVTIYEIVDYID